MQDKTSKILSPINGSSKVKLVKKISTEEISLRWLDEFSIDITSELSSIKSVSLYCCEESSLEFYIPHTIAGSSLLYEKLSELDWYYMSDKWEFLQAENDLKGLDRVAEIGCAKGDYLERLFKKGFDVFGFEYNEKAAKEAISKGIEVTTKLLDDVDPNLIGSFDAVCSFQVLEHVTEPMELLKQSLALLKPGGKLIISVPNGNVAKTTLTDALLDMPPHHMSKWFKQTFKVIERYLPVKLYRIAEEPLAAYHVNWYLQSVRRKVPSTLGLRLLYKMSLEQILRIGLFLGARKLITGHTLYVCYKKL